MHRRSSLKLTQAEAGIADTKMKLTGLIADKESIPQPYKKSKSKSKSKSNKWLTDVLAPIQ